MRTFDLLRVHKILRQYTWWLKSWTYLTKSVSCEIKPSYFVFDLFEISWFKQLMSWVSNRWHSASYVIQILIWILLNIWWECCFHWPLHIKNLLLIVVSESRIVSLSYIWWCNCKILNFKFLLWPLFNTIIIWTHILSLSTSHLPRNYLLPQVWIICHCWFFM